MALIAGLVHWDRGSVSPEIGRRLVATLALPGVEPIRLREAKSSVLACGLQPTLPEDRFDRQPLTDESGAVLAFDGRLDNRSDLIRSLGLDRRDLADSDIAVAAIQRWGDEAPRHLIGDFAFAVWNPHEERLLLVRDRIGIRNLFYYADHRHAAFASTPRALLALLGSPRELDETGLADLLTLNRDEPTRTVWRGVKQLSGGGRAVITASGARIDSYWQLDPERRLRLASDEAYVEAARDLLETSVACRLRSSGPVVAQLSGGLDSSAVAVTAGKRLAPNRLTTLTSVPPPDFKGPVPAGNYADERGFIELIGKMHPGLDTELFQASAEDSHFDFVERSVASLGLPYRGADDVAWSAPLRRRAQELGATVILTGMLGNYGLSWDGLHLLDDLFAAANLPRFVHEAAALAHATGRSPLRPVWAHGLRHLLPDIAVKMLDRLRGRAAPDWTAYSPINPRFAAEMRVGERLAVSALRPFLRHADDGRRWRALLITGVSATQQAGAAANCVRGGLENRNPLADHRLLEFCLAIPQDQFLRNGKTRWLARRVLADRLPAEVINNLDRGAQSPAWFDRLSQDRAALAAEIDELSRSPLASRYLDVERLRRLVEHWPASSQDALRRFAEYRSALIRGINHGRFLRWVESGAE